MSPRAHPFVHTPSSVLPAHTLTPSCRMRHRHEALRLQRQLCSDRVFVMELPGFKALRAWRALLIARLATGHQPPQHCKPLFTPPPPPLPLPPPPTPSGPGRARAPRRSASRSGVRLEDRHELLVAGVGGVHGQLGRAERGLTTLHAVLRPAADGLLAQRDRLRARAPTQSARLIGRVAV